MISPDLENPSADESALAHHFDDFAQQHQARILGMWVFLVTEVMFFGGLFLAYLVYRWSYPNEFAAGSRHLDIVLGAINTGVLLTSSLTMALAVEGAQQGRGRRVPLFLLATMALGAVFLAIKFTEYYHKYEEHWVGIGNLPRAAALERDRGLELFSDLYFAMTGVHALHMVVGIGIMLTLLVPAVRGRYAGQRAEPIELLGLYWHFVDIVWIFLFPLLYLIDRS